MKMDFSINLTHEQKLIMTHQMQLSIKLLQMSTYELDQYINQQMEENPVLEVSHNAEIQDKNDDMSKIDYKELIKYLDFDNYNHDNAEKYNSDDEVSPFNFISEQKSLKEYLIEQIIELNESKKVKFICRYLAENIDENGYLTEDLSQMASKINVSKDQMNKALNVFQSLDPSGIGARNIKECLEIQMMRKNLTDKNLYKIVEDYLEYLAEARYSTIAKEMSLDLVDVQKYCDIIKTLEPKPSRGFYTGEDTKYIIPDAYIRKLGEKYYIIMNDNVLPHLIVNNTYKNIISNEVDSNLVSYVKGKINDAVFLINSIEKRKSTIYRILEKIVDYQRDYFDYGEHFLKPMTLKEMAEAINMHESTVSRAIKDKYVSTSRGIVKIKDLFTTALHGFDSNDSVSVVTIKDKIKKLIEDEEKTKPLSDQHIADMLSKSDTKIARRTVAKYREELGIKSSGKRKRFK